MYQYQKKLVVNFFLIILKKMLIVYYLYLLFLIADSFNRYIITVKIDTTKLEEHGRVHLFILIDFSETINSVVVIFSNSLMCSIYFSDKEPLLIF